MNPLSALIAVLDRLAISYLIGGSHASSARGVRRASLDVDLLAAIPAAKVDQLAAALGRDWYADAGQMRDAISRGRSFNLIFIPQAEKFDIFPASEEFHRSQLTRATVETVEFAGETIACRVATAEDILLAKLRWYKDGGEVSERQWRDVAGIVATNPSLDVAYLQHWAARLDVLRLLARAMEAGS